MFFFFGLFYYCNLKSSSGVNLVFGLYCADLFSIILSFILNAPRHIKNNETDNDNLNRKFNNITTYRMAEQL